MTAQAGLCRTWSETQIVGFLMHRLKYDWLIISVGYTTKDEDYLKFLFEGSPDFCVVPSFAVIPAMNASTGMFMGGVPGLRVDPTKVTMKFHES